MSHDDPSQRVPELDGLRGLAILLVLIWHYIAASLKPELTPAALPLLLLLSNTWSGVDLFFVLSGFLIGGILMDNRASPNYFKAFYTLRVCRIVPIYYVWLIVFVLLGVILPALLANPEVNRLFAPPQPMWTYFMFTHNIAMAAQGDYGAPWLSVTWSLAIEEQFYLMLPLLVRLIAPRRLPQVLIGLIVTAPILRILLHSTLPRLELATYMLMPCRMDALLLGVLCAYAVRQPRLKQLIARHTKWLYAALLVFVLGVGTLSIIPSDTNMPHWGYSWLAMLYACLLLVAITERRGCGHLHRAQSHTAPPRRI